MRTARSPLVLLLVGVLAVLGACASDGAGDDAGQGGTATSAGGSAASGELSVLSYNVAGLPQEISGENPSTNIPLISPLLAPYDLVLTQEDFDWWSDQLDAMGLDFVNYHTRLRAEAGFPHATERHPGPEAVGLVTGPDRPDPFVGDGLGLLSRTPFSDVVRMPWAGCFGGADTSDGGAGDCLAMKGFMVATVEVAPGATVDVYNLHAEAGGCGPDQALQVEDFAQLAAFMAEHSAGRPVILGGDTNLHTDDVHEDSCGDADTPIWQQFLADTGLTDVCDALSCDDPGAIDKMAFRSGGGLTIDARTWQFEREVFIDAAGEPLSDHDALHVVFAWRAQG